MSHDVTQEPTTPSGRPIVAFNNSDPDITIRFREQFRNLDLSSKSVTEKSPAENLARSDSDLLNIGHSLGISFDHVTRSIEIENKGKFEQNVITSRVFDLISLSMGLCVFWEGTPLC